MDGREHFEQLQTQRSLSRNKPLLREWFVCATFTDSKIIRSMLAYLKYRWKAKDAHGIHSPFVFSLYSEAIAAEGRYYAFDGIEALRARLLKDLSSIRVYGQWDMVHELARRVLPQVKEGQLLFRLANFMKAKYMIEIGTSLGITTLYQSHGRGEVALHSFEPDAAKAGIARDVIAALRGKAVVHEHLDVAEILEKIPTLDWVLVNEAASYQEIHDILNKCLAKSHEDTIFVFRNLRKDETVAKLWQYLLSLPQVHISTDLYILGIAFLRKKQTKQHFLLKF